MTNGQTLKSSNKSSESVYHKKSHGQVDKNWAYIHIEHFRASLFEFAFVREREREICDIERSGILVLRTSYTHLRLTYPCTGEFQICFRRFVYVCMHGLHCISSVGCMCRNGVTQVTKLHNRVLEFSFCPPKHDTRVPHIIQNTQVTSEYVIV